MGKYEDAGLGAIKSGELEFAGNNQTLILSLKVLDTLSENFPELSAKYALIALDDAKSILLQLLGI